MGAACLKSLMLLSLRGESVAVDMAQSIMERKRRGRKWEVQLGDWIIYHINFMIHPLLHVHVATAGNWILELRGRGLSHVRSSY